MYFRNRLFFGIIKSVIKAVVGVVYKIISIFNLQITFLVGLIGVVLYFTGVFDANPTYAIIFQIMLALSAVYAIIVTLKKLLGLDKKVKKSKGIQIVKPGKKPKGKEDKPNEQESESPKPNVPEKPVYYKVKQNPNYVMAEYSDRYELYKIVEGQLEFIRTDLK